MIVCVGDKYKFGGLLEVFYNRLPNEEITFIKEANDIKKQENDILFLQNVTYILYDTFQYYNDAEEVIKVIKGIYNANKINPILLMPTTNPNADLVKEAVSSQFKCIIDTSLSLSEQKEQLEKMLVQYYLNNTRQDIENVEKVVNAEIVTLQDFVSELYIAKQREVAKEKTIIIYKKRIVEIFADIIKIGLNILITILCTIALITLTYKTSRLEFLEVFNNIYNEFFKMLGIGA